MWTTNVPFVRALRICAVPVTRFWPPVQKVPEGVSVASDLSILTQLIPGRTVYWIGHTGEPAPDYVVIDRKSNSWGGNPPTNAAQYAADRYGHSYAKYATVGTIDIVRRVD